MSSAAESVALTPELSSAKERCSFERFFGSYRGLHLGKHLCGAQQTFFRQSSGYGVLCSLSSRNIKHITVDPPKALGGATDRSPCLCLGDRASCKSSGPLGYVCPTWLKAPGHLNGLARVAAFMGTEPHYQKGPWALPR